MRGYKPDDSSAVVALLEVRIGEQEEHLTKLNVC